MQLANDNRFNMIYKRLNGQIGNRLKTNYVSCQYLSKNIVPKSKSYIGNHIYCYSN